MGGSHKTPPHLHVLTLSLDCFSCQLTTFTKQINPQKMKTIKQHNAPAFADI
jgi:hypothetical protein